MTLDERTTRVCAALRQVGADYAVLTGVDSVCYATGFECSVEWGPSPFAGGPIVALVTSEGATALVVSNLEEAPARASRATSVFAYEGLSPERHPALEANYVDALEEACAALGVAGVAAIEPGTCTATVQRAVAGSLERYVSLSPVLERVRAEKTSAEVTQLRECARLTAVGQRAALHASQPGRTELDAFAGLRAAMENEAGGRLALTGDYVSGVDRTAECEGWPNQRVLREGDPVIADLAPRHGGYWGDSCNTFVLGDPSEAFADLYRVVQAALETCCETLRPGISAGDLDRKARAVIEGAGYVNLLHTGHGIGTSVHEFPRIVGEETAVLKPGMVLMLEPGAYKPGVGGVRLEWMFLVTETGNEVLSPFEHSLHDWAPAR